MSLELEHRWEHALIAVTIKTASEECPSCPLQLNAVQKLIYFLKMLEVPMDYQFSLRRRGPNCQEIPFDIEWLMADDIIKKTDKSNFVASTKYVQLYESYKTEFSDCFSKIDSVCKTFSEMSPSTLDLMASLDFSYRWVKASGGSDPLESRTKDKFRSIDNGNYSDNELDHWYDKLVEVDLVTR